MRTGEAIDVRKGENTAAFIGYLPAGFPDGARSVRAAQELAKAGADIIEIGLPYSDPTMDGGTIQVAGQRALANGFRVRDVFANVEAVANTGAVPLIMTYYNLIFRYGVQDFARDFASAGGAGLITPDLIPDEAGDWIAASDHRRSNDHTIGVCRYLTRLSGRGHSNTHTDSLGPSRASALNELACPFIDRVSRTRHTHR